MPAFQRLCMLAECILCSPQRAGKAHARRFEALVRQRMERWQSGDLSGLWEQTSRTRMTGRKQPRAELAVTDELQPLRVALPSAAKESLPRRSFTP